MVASRLYLSLLLLSGNALALEGPVIERFDVVTEQASPGDGGNAWGGHQCRIVRTKFGVFTAYTADGGSGGQFNRSWRLMRQTDTGWEEIASGPSGREPVNLLAKPDGQLLVVAWPFKQPVIFASRMTKEGQLEMDPAGLPVMMDDPVPGQWEMSHWPYNAAGIDADDNLVVCQSPVGHKPGRFNLALRLAGRRDWLWRTVDMDLRHCYTYLIPAGRQLWIASSQDVTYRELGYPIPEKAKSYPYVFNALGVWCSHDVKGAEPPALLWRKEEPYDPQEMPNPSCKVQETYLDTIGRLHVFYALRSPTTDRKERMYHAVLKDGRVVYDQPSPAHYYCRMVQDSAGRFYILDAAGDRLRVLVGQDESGTRFADPIEFDTHGHPVEYAGFGWSAPRTGTPLADTAEVVYPSGKGKEWVYFRLRLRPENAATQPGTMTNPATTRSAEAGN